MLNSIVKKSLLNNGKFISTRQNLLLKNQKKLFSTSFKRLETSNPNKVLIKKPFYKRAGSAILKYGLIGSFLGISYVSYALYKENNPSKQIPQSDTFENGSKRKTVVILGSGWGSISLLKSLDTSLYNVIVVSPRNYFLFTPLLPSTPVGTVELKSIIEPVRSIARRSNSEVTYYEADALTVDHVAKLFMLNLSMKMIMRQIYLTII